MERCTLSKAEVIENLREAFDARVSKEFCITSEETSALLATATVNIILQSFSNLGKFLVRDAEQNLIFHPQEFIVETLLPREIQKELKKIRDVRADRKWDKRRANAELDSTSK